MLNVLLSCEKACTLHCQWNLHFKYLPRNSKKNNNLDIFIFFSGGGCNDLKELFDWFNFLCLLYIICTNIM